MKTLIEMRGITKVYPNGVIANNRVNLEISSGEIHAIVGENGAGKTTLMKILAGFVKPDEGEIFYKGEKIKISSPSEALEKGIGMVHQHFMLVPSLTVAENIVLGMEPRKGLSFDLQKAISLTKEISKKYNMYVNPNSKVKDIPVGMKQKVEILKSLLRGAEILILDEPTAVFTPQETESLFESLLTLKKQGHTIIFITHKLKEVKKISDRITVMKKGRNVATIATQEVSEKEISQMMVGRDVIFEVEKLPVKPGKIVLEVKNLRAFSENGRMMLKNINFAVREREIVGIAGVAGNGQSELVEILSGLRKAERGQILINGIDITNKSTKIIRNNKVSHIPEDRMKYGTALEATVEENLISDRYDKPEFNRILILNKKKIQTETEKLVKEFNIAVNSVKTKIKMLSGGNVQKVVVAREISSNPCLLLANQPTRGVDIGGREFVHRKLIEMREKSVGILLISSDIDELMCLSDRLLIIYEGELVAAFSDVDKINEEEIGLYMLGIKKQNEITLREEMI